MYDVHTSTILECVMHSASYFCIRDRVEWTLYACKIGRGICLYQISLVPMMHITIRPKKPIQLEIWRKAQSIKSWLLTWQDESWLYLHSTHSRICNYCLAFSKLMKNFKIIRYFQDSSCLEQIIISKCGPNVTT